MATYEESTSELLTLTESVIDYPYPNFDSHTSSLLQFPGADESTTIRDRAGLTWLAHGGAKIDTAQYKFKATSLYLNGEFEVTADYIYTNEYSAFNFGSGDFTIDFWIRPSADLLFGQDYYFVAQGYKPSQTSNNGFLLAYVTDGEEGQSWAFSYSTTGADNNYILFGTWVEDNLIPAPAKNTWTHIAIERYGSDLNAYVNGYLSGTESITGSIYNSTSSLSVGNAIDNDYWYVNGWVDEFRVSKGIARYKGVSFAPMDEEYFYPHDYLFSETTTITDEIVPDHLVELIEEVATLTDEIIGTPPVKGSTSEDISLTDEITELHLVDSTSETATLTDESSAHRTTYASISEIGTLTDVITELHLVDETAETATITDDLEFFQTIVRNKVKFPNLQGQHISLKFANNDGNLMALYYLREKMYKTINLNSDQKHPNTQDHHIGVKLTNSADEAFILDHVSMEMYRVDT